VAAEGREALRRLGLAAAAPSRGRRRPGASGARTCRPPPTGGPPCCPPGRRPRISGSRRWRRRWRPTWPKGGPGWVRR